MLELTKQYDNICKLTDLEYTTNRYAVVNNFFNEYTVKVLDFKIKVKEDYGGIFEASINLVAVDLNKDFLEILQTLTQYEEEENEEHTYELELLIKLD